MKVKTEKSKSLHKNRRLKVKRSQLLCSEYNKPVPDIMSFTLLPSFCKCIQQCSFLDFSFFFNEEKNQLCVFSCPKMAEKLW